MQVQDDKPYDDINITPMLDLAYVLLVIFILMCTASVQGLKVNLPAGSAATKSLAGLIQTAGNAQVVCELAQMLRAIHVYCNGQFCNVYLSKLLFFPPAKFEVQLRTVK